MATQMATLAHEKVFYQVKATIQKYDGEKNYQKILHCGRIFADKINGLGIGFKRAMQMHPKEDIVSVDLIRERGVLPIPKNKNLCNGCRSQGDCIATGHEG